MSTVDWLPSADDDPIIRLHDYYYQTATLMREGTEKLERVWLKEGHFTRTQLIKFQSYNQLWLGMLWVVAEGFLHASVQKHFRALILSERDLELQVHWSSIHYQIGQLGADLQGARNTIFHYQPQMKSLESRREKFFKFEERHPIQWAKALHDEMHRFFSAYRIYAAIEGLLRNIAADKRPEEGSS